MQGIGVNLIEISHKIEMPDHRRTQGCLERPDEAYELGFEEALIEGIVLIEWPERLGPLLPDERLELHFEFAERNEARRVALIGTGAWARRLRHLEPPWGRA